MNKEEHIKRYGEAAYEKMLRQSCVWQAQHREECNVSQRSWVKRHPKKAKENDRVWREANPDKVEARNHQRNRKGGKYYMAKLKYMRTGLQGERARIRMKHGQLYHDIRQATPNTQIHHEWIPKTSKYRGVALVEKGAHERGIIKVIKILEGEITLFTEKEIKNR